MRRRYLECRTASFSTGLLMMAKFPLLGPHDNRCVGCGERELTRHRHDAIHMGHTLRSRHTPVVADLLRQAHSHRTSAHHWQSRLNGKGSCPISKTYALPSAISLLHLAEFLEVDLFDVLNFVERGRVTSWRK